MRVKAVDFHFLGVRTMRKWEKVQSGKATAWSQRDAKRRRACTPLTGATTHRYSVAGFDTRSPTSRAQPMSHCVAFLLSLIGPCSRDELPSYPPDQNWENTRPLREYLGMLVIIRLSEVVLGDDAFAAMARRDHDIHPRICIAVVQADPKYLKLTPPPPFLTKGPRFQLLI
jgi:hypothetical protein